MARVPNMTRVTLVGTLPNAEIFSTGFWVGPNTIASETAANAYAQLISTSFIATADQTFAKLMGAGAGFQEVQVYHYVDTEGPADYVGTAPCVVPGTSPTGNQLPIQCAVVTTLETGLSGRRRRGRMYWPCIVALLDGHQLSQATIAEIVGALAAFFGEVNAYVGQGDVVVHSQVEGGSAADVTRVSCDSEVDIQRRRANRQIELRQAAAVVA